MAAGTWTLVNSARQNLLNGTFIITTDSWKVAIVTGSSNIGAATTTFAGVTNELSTANGYTAGGQAVTLNISGTTSVPVVFASNPVWTATGGSLTGRTVVLYEVGGNVLAYCLLDSTNIDVTATSGNTLTIDSDGAPQPVFTLN